MAEGNVVVVEGQAVLSCHRATVTLPGLLGRLDGGELRLKQGIRSEVLTRTSTGAWSTVRDRATLAAERIERTGPRRYDVRDVSLTTCDCGEARPSWSIRASRASVAVDSGAWLYGAGFLREGGTRVRIAGTLRTARRSPVGSLGPEGSGAAERDGLRRAAAALSRSGRFRRPHARARLLHRAGPLPGSRVSVRAPGDHHRNVESKLRGRSWASGPGSRRPGFAVCGGWSPRDDLRANAAVGGCQPRGRSRIRFGTRG